MATRVHRTTLFKIPDPEDRKKLLEAYQKLSKDQKKDGKPYILYVCAGEAHDDPRSNGYTVVAKTEFASMEDMKYYDDECPAHAELKKTVTTLNVSEKPMSVYFTSSATVLE